MELGMRWGGFRRVVAISSVGEACQGEACLAHQPRELLCSSHAILLPKRKVNEDAVAHVVAGCNCCQNPTGFFYEAAGQAKASLEYLVRAVHILEQRFVLTCSLYRLS